MRRVWVGVLVASLVPYGVWGQTNTPPASEPATAPAGQSATLPTINVPVPKQKAKRTAEKKRPPAKQAAPARVRTTAPVRTRTPAPPVETPPASSVAEGGGGEDTIGVSPVPGSAIARDKVPSNGQVLSRATFDRGRSPDFLDAIGQYLPFVSLSDQNGNQFQRDVNYRGFTASPLIGTPQGLAIYQNGIRVNEVFGDTVNWDFIPDIAINRMELVPNNPVYGLNALGGAISIEMKNGFTWQGFEAALRGGAYGRLGYSLQAGGQKDGWATYAAAEVINDNGWRNYSPSQVRRIYTDIGSRSDEGEFHVTFTGADNFFGAAAATPIQMLAQNWSNIYTLPQTTEQSLAFLTSSLTYRPSDTLTLQGLLYYRGFWQRHVDGNGTNATNQNCPDPNFLCFPNLDGTVSNLTTTGGQSVPAVGILANSVLGEVDRTWTSTNSYGGSFQATSTDKVFGRDNHLVVGTSLDRGHVQFTSTSELGTINPDQFPFVYGTGVIINQPSGDLAPVGLHADTTYIGVYATDTFDVTSRLSVTAGGRYNIALIALQDELGNALNGFNEYMRFNPVIGATYKLAPNVTIYGGYSESNRAPTPLELACADPNRPCLIDSFLVADPSLKEVVGHTFETGIRGKFHFGPGYGQMNWSLGAFHTLSDDDIIQVASPLPGHGFFQNAGTTLRQGIEASVNYKQERWTTYANFTYIDATFQSTNLLSSPNNPVADADGNILVTPGDHIPAIPAYRFKAGAEYAVTDKWKIGADVNVIGSQYLFGDQSNQNPEVPAYWVVNAHTSYQVNKDIEVFGLVQNLFNQHYYVFGTFFETDSFPYLNLSDPRTFVPGMPFAVYAGMRAKLPTAAPAVDLPAAAPLVKAPVYAPSPFSWTGFYLGGNIGGAWASNNWTLTDPAFTMGFAGTGDTNLVGGGQIGFNYQTGNFVWGLEGEAEFLGNNNNNSAVAVLAPVDGNGVAAADTLQAMSNYTWMATVAARLGFALDRALIYGKIGWGWAGNDGLTVTDQTSNTAASGIGSFTQNGWLVGGGVEWAFAYNWTVKLEYSYLSLGNQTLTVPATAPILAGDTFTTTNPSIQSVKLGVNYLFNWGGPVVARY